MTILSGWVAASFWLDEYIPKIMGIGGLTILFVVGVLTILPLKYSKNFFIRVINYLLSGILILMLVFSFIFFFSIQSNKFYGDWLAIPLTIVGSLLVGLFCLPFLIYKSWRFKKVAKNYNE
jgi:asparagine N-glycosylation enzyme membrane subunit Stt3